MVPEVASVDASSEIETQTMTVVGKAAVDDDSTALLLGLLGYSATKLWNSAIWQSRQVWQSTGKILSYGEFDNAVKQNCTRWYRSLHSQSAQAILEEIGVSYRSWFTLRKKGAITAKPPGFRPKGILSAVTFKQQAAVWNPILKTLRLSIPKEVYGKQFLYVKVHIWENPYLTSDNLQIARLVYDHGDWYVHLVCKVPLPGLKGPGEVMSIDLNIKNLAASACTDGTTRIWSAGELAAIERYFDREKAKTNSSRSRKSMELNCKRSRQRNHLLHGFTKSLVRDANARGVSTIIVGYPKDIRFGKDWGANGNRHLHRWPYKKILSMLTYKARMLGILVVEADEAYTSQTCHACKTRNTSNRVHRGLYVCRSCGAVIQADINAAINMLQNHHAMYLPGTMGVSWSSGCLAQPAVNRFAWRNTKPVVLAHEPGTWQTTLPQLRTPQFVSEPAVRV
jgi:putative transposase